jgi:hypothetical protein
MAPDSAEVCVFVKFGESPKAGNVFGVMEFSDFVHRPVFFRRRTKSEKSVISSVIHRRQNPLGNVLFS